MKFADEFIENAGQVTTMVMMMQKITGNAVPLIYNTPYGKAILSVVPYSEPAQVIKDGTVKVEEMEASKENAQPTPEGD